MGGGVEEKVDRKELQLLEQAKRKQGLTVGDVMQIEMAYVKRIMANFFYDWAYEPYLRTTGKEHFHALGLGLKLNMHLFTLPIPLEVGISYAYRPISKDYSPLFKLGTF